MSNTTENNQNNPETIAYQDFRLEKKTNLENANIPPYISSYTKNKDIQTALPYNTMDKPTLESENVELILAGRVMAMRKMGKASFFTIADRTGSIQIYIKIGNLDDNSKTVVENMDVGDFLACHGVLFKTNTNELTLKTHKVEMLTKSLAGLPEKWHGLKDVEKRYRQRYNDLVINNDIKQKFIIRSKTVSHIRNYLENLGFYEVETPMMHTLVTGAAAEPFSTHHNALNMDLYLRIASELHLKRLVVGGFERVFELNRNFRNEGVSTRHNPEFTMIEWYMAYSNYEQIMDMVQDIITTAAVNILGTGTIPYGDKVLNLSQPWEKLTMFDAILKHSSLQPENITGEENLTKTLQTLGIKKEDSWGAGRMLAEVFEEVAEKHLFQPTFIIDFPTEVSPLAKAKDDDPNTTERFELYIANMEVANGFNELNDPIDQYERFKKQLEDRDAGDKETTDMDEDYINALAVGLPPTTGIGVGIDRLVMLLTNSQSIREVILFPHMRSEHE